MKVKNKVDEKSIRRISIQVARRFPEFSKAKPSVRRRHNSGKDNPQFLLTYKAKAKLPGGRTLDRIVRVVVDADGHILRMTTSR